MRLNPITDTKHVRRETKPLACAYLLAIDGRVLAVIGAEEELPVEQLHSDDGEDELEQNVHDQNVDDILERVDDTVEHRFQFGHTLDGFQRSQHAQHSQRFDGGEVLSHAALVAVAGTICDRKCE